MSPAMGTADTERATMDLATLDEFMCQLGISRNPANLSAMIRFVQRCEGNAECFGTSRKDCRQFRCAWRALCTDRRALSTEAAPPVVRIPRPWTTVFSPRRAREESVA